MPTRKSVPRRGDFPEPFNRNTQDRVRGQTSRVAHGVEFLQIDPLRRVGEVAFGYTDEGIAAAHGIPPFGPMNRGLKQQHLRKNKGKRPQSVCDVGCHEVP